MDFEVIETALYQHLKKQLGADFHYTVGPQQAPAYAGIRTEINVHAAEYLDFGGVTTDGAVVARCGIREAGLRGYTEDRPAMIVIVVSCVAANYRIVRRECGHIAPTVLSFLGSMGELQLGTSPDGGSQIGFVNGKSCLHRSATSMEQDGKGAYYRGQLQFNLDGFLHVTARWKARRKGR